MKVKNLTVFEVEDYAYLVGESTSLMNLGIHYPTRVQQFITSDRVLCIGDYSKSQLQSVVKELFHGKLKLRFSSSVPEYVKVLHEKMKYGWTRKKHPESQIN